MSSASAPPARAGNPCVGCELGIEYSIGRLAGEHAAHTRGGLPVDGSWSPATRTSSCFLTPARPCRRGGRLPGFTRWPPAIVARGRRLDFLVPTVRSSRRETPALRHD